MADRALVKWKATNALARVKSFMQFVTGGRGSNWWGYTNLPMTETNPGDWQRNIPPYHSRETLVAFSAVYACISLIADDISKLPILLKRLDKNGVWTEITDKTSPFYRLMRKPNDFQTSIQFISLWLVCKLLYGNVYVFLERDERGVVVQMYILDPRRVRVSVTEDGDVFYSLSTDRLAGLKKDVDIPSTEIIHDRMLCLWHPLCGVPPIVACGGSATQGLKIQSNSAKFFENMSRPSGHLTTEGEISDVTAKRLKEEFERNFSGGNLGRLLVTGDGLRYEPFTIPPEQAQLIEQLKWTVEDVARCFKIPPYKLGLTGTAPALNTVGALNQEYYSQCLQIHIESIELLFDTRLPLPNDVSVEIDEEVLMRMDPLSRATRDAAEIGCGKLAPNEARARDGFAPVTGGDTPYLQQQNYALSALARRDALADPFNPGRNPPAATPAEDEDEDDLEDVEELATSLIAKFSEHNYADEKVSGD